MRAVARRATLAAAVARDAPAPRGGRPPPPRRAGRPASSTAPPPSRSPSTHPSIEYEPPWSPADVAAVRAVLDTPTPPADHSRPLLALTVDELKALVVEHGQPAYRGQQLYDGITRGATTWDDFTSVPKALRESLAARGARVGRSPVHATSVSSDGTTKLLLRLSDGHVIETVAIPSLRKRATEGDGHTRWTACVSSQVGCPMRCSFCATGKGGYARQLAAHEIVDQVLAASATGAAGGARPANVVFMGMGEPLLNLKAVLPALRTLQDRLGIGARKITVSTVGVPNAIGRLAAERSQVGLAVSLHAPTQALRESLVPSAKAYPLDALLADCVGYFEATGRRVTFEYALLAGVNDAPHHAASLAKLLKRYDLRSHVNLIPFNAVAGASFGTPSRVGAAAFAAALTEAGVPASVRVNRGADAGAACGQLRNEHQKTPLAATAAA